MEMECKEVAKTQALSRCQCQYQAKVSWSLLWGARGQRLGGKCVGNQRNVNRLLISLTPHTLPVLPLDQDVCRCRWRWSCHLYMKWLLLIYIYI